MSAFVRSLTRAGLLCKPTETAWPYMARSLQTFRREQHYVAYGAFGIVRDGRLFSYHYLCRKDLEKLLLGQEVP